MSAVSMQPGDLLLLEQCDESLLVGDWTAAADRASKCLESSPGLPEALERLARAHRWLNQIDGCFAAREQAFVAYRERGDVGSAARMASLLGYDNVIARHEVAVANGWFARAHDLLADGADPLEFGWLRYREAQVARLVDHDYANAIGLANEALAAAQESGDGMLESAVLSVTGLIEVCLGDVTVGMEKLDKAGTAAVSGEIPVLEVAGVICCDMISACEQIRDAERARDWLRAAARIGEQGDFAPLIGTCQVHYASILMWEGDWNGAERALDRARTVLELSGDGLLGDHAIRLAHLRMLQGRLDEAWEICESLSWLPEAKLAQARIAHMREDNAAAEDLLGRFSRNCEGCDQQTKAEGWSLSVTLAIERGEVDSAKEAARELTAIADDLQTSSLRASAALASGRIKAAEHDYSGARAEIERAIDLWSRARHPYDAAAARLALATVIEAAGDEATAEAERAKADESITELTRPDSEKSDDNGSPVADGPLTPREVEVLSLVADGMSDEEVADRLFLSPHTVHRHVANIRNKLDQPTRAAAVAHAARNGLL